MPYVKKNFVDHCKKYWLFYTFSEIKGEGGGILKLYRYFIVSVQKMGRKTYSFLVTRSYLVFSLIIKIKCGNIAPRHINTCMYRIQGYHAVVSRHENM